MKKINLIVLLLLMVQVAVAQRLIRRSSRYYVEAQTLPEKVEPLLTDTWDQYAPYHNMCPIDSTGERCVVGCVGFQLVGLHLNAVLT